MINKIFNSSRGFTVLESLVAIFVLSLSISGVFAAVQTSLSQTIIAKDEVKAFYLAQEAIEIIRNKRDANQLLRFNGASGLSWLDDISENASDACFFGKICRTDSVSPIFTYCGNSWGSCPYLTQDLNNFLYNYTTGSATNFKREIQLESINSNEITVTVRVSWVKGLTTREFKAKTQLFNWIPLP